MAGPIAEAYVEIRPSDQGFSKETQQMVTRALSGLRPQVEKAAQGLSTALKGSFDGLSEAARSETSKVEGVFSGIKGKLSTAFDPLKDASRTVGEAFDRVRNKVESIGDGITRPFRTASERMTEAFSRFRRSASDDLDRIERQSKNTADRAGGHFKGFATVAAGALATVGFGSFVADSVNQAADLGESINAISVVLGEKAAPSFLEFSSTASSALGTTQSSLNQALVPAASLLKNAGLQGEGLSTSLQALAQRATDTGSVMNKDVNEVLEAFGAAVRGETEPVRALGINFNDAAVQAKAMELGLASSTGEVSEAAKTQARLALVMEQSEQYAGDFANTADSLPNLMKTLKATGQEASAALGTALIPTLTGLAQSFFPLIEAAKPVLEVLGGGIGSVVDTLATAIIPLTQTVLPPLADAFSIIGEVLQELGPEIGEFSAVFGEALAGILPLITEIAVGIGGPAIGAILDVLTSLMFPLNEMAASILPILVDAFNVLGPVIRDVGDALSGALLEVLVALEPVLPDLAMAAADLIVLFAEFLKVITPLIGPIGKLLAKLAPILPLFLALLGPWGMLVAAVYALKKAWDLLKGPFMAVIGLFGDLEGLPGKVGSALSSFGTIVGGALRTGLEAIGTIIQTAFNLWLEWWVLLPVKVVGALASLATTVGPVVLEAMTAIGQFIFEALANWVQWHLELPGRLVTALATLLSRLKETFSTALTAVREVITTAFTNFVRFHTEFPGRVVSALSSLGGRLASTASSAFSTMRGAISTALSGILGFVGDQLAKIPRAVGNLGSGIASAASGIWNGLTSAFRNAINTIIRGWNRLRFTIPKIDPPGPGPTFGGQTIGVPRIPLLARGGILTSPTLAAVAEAGSPEAVIPLNQQGALFMQRVLQGAGVGQDGGMSVTFGQGSIAVSFAGDVTPAKAYAAGQAIGDGVAERLAERNLALRTRVQ